MAKAEEKRQKDRELREEAFDAIHQLGKQDKIITVNGKEYSMKKYSQLLFYLRRNNKIEFKNFPEGSKYAGNHTNGKISINTRYDENSSLKLGLAGTIIHELGHAMDYYNIAEDGTITYKPGGEYTAEYPRTNSMQEEYEVELVSRLAEKALGVGDDVSKTKSQIKNEVHSWVQKHYNLSKTDSNSQGWPFGVSK